MKKFLFLLVLVLALVASPAAAQVGNVSDEAHFAVDITAVSCFTDFHFFDNWKTTATASWPTDARKVVQNRYRVLAFEDGLLFAEAPMGAGHLDVSGRDLSELSFKVEQRFTGKRTAVPVGNSAIAYCSFMPPMDGMAWVWSSEHTAFVLKPVVTTGPPLKARDVDLQWSSE